MQPEGGDDLEDIVACLFEVRHITGTKTFGVVENLLGYVSSMRWEKAS